MISGIADENLENNSMPFNATEANQKDKEYKFSIKLLSNLTRGTCSQELSEDNIENYVRTHGQMVYNLDAVKKKHASKRSSKRAKTLTPIGSSIHTIVRDVIAEREKLKRAMELNNTTYPPHPQNNGDNGRGGGFTGEDDLLKYLRNRDKK